MKRIFFIISIILIFMGYRADAQRQKETKTFGAEFEWNFVGDYTYQFLRQENGKLLKDGPFSMIATINKKGLQYKTWYKANITGKYNLTGNHSNGNIHGALIMDANLSINATNGDKVNTTYTFRGNFKNGIPDGNFKVDYPSYNIKVNVNYKDSILVGGYYVKGLGDNSLPFTTSGTLTSSGKPTGTWKFESIYGIREETFTNGILINRSDYDSELREKAKSYAAGSISIEKLMQENICVRKDTMLLGKDAWNQILSNGIEFEDMGGYSFSRSKSVGYEYLDRLPSLSAVGYQKFKDGIVDYIKNGGTNEDFSSNASNERKLIIESYIKAQELRLDESCGLYFMNIHYRNQLSEYCTGYPDWSDYSENIYLFDEQYKEVQQLMHDTRKENIDKYPISYTQFSASSRYKSSIAEYFIPSEFDPNIITYKLYNIYNKDNILYFSRDAFESYFINLGYAEEIQKISPENRREIIQAKIDKKLEEDRLKEEEKKRQEEARKRVIKEQYKNTATSWFKNELIGQPKYRYSETRDMPDYLYPIISYNAKEVILLDSYDKNGVICKVISLVNIENKDYSKSSFTEIWNDNTPKYNTYEMTVFFSDSRSINKKLTFAASNFKRIPNEYDTIKELNSQILDNNNKIKQLSTSTFKDGYKAYNAYIKNSKSSINRNDIKSSINERNKILAVQDSIFCFIEKINLIQAGDANIISQCGNNKEVLKAYLTYEKTRDLSWSPNWSIEKLDEYIRVQERTVEFLEIINKIQRSDNDITSQSSNKKDIQKAYLTHTKTRDLTWSPNWNLDKLNEYISIQERCLEFIKLRDNIQDNDVKINSLKSDSPTIFKAYNTYHSSCDITWKPDVDFETIESLIKIQEKYIRSVSVPNISDVDKKVKKQKMTNLIQILELEELN